MTMPIEPYLFFEGRCEEALQLYTKVLGAKVEMMMRNKESPEPPPPGMLPAGSENKIMHASLRIGEGRIMASDGHCSGSPSFKGISLSVAARDEAEAKRFFAGLSDGGAVQVPLGKTFFARAFGMLTDRFGVPWMIICE
jgi:PhnB protein